MVHAFPLLALLLTLAACSRDPAPPPERSVFEAQIKAVGRAKDVEKIGLERKAEIDAKLDRQADDD